MASSSQKNETKLIFDVNSHPFSDQIMAEPLASPFPFQFPNIEKYSIFNDPTEHLQIFTSQMLPYAASDALRCRLFPTTLSKEALPWFFDLAPKSINSFQELANSFVMKFALSKPFNNPFAFKQKNNETAQDFIGRVNSSLIADGVKASPDEIIGVIRKGLRDGSFKETFMKDIPTDLNQLWEIANLEDDQVYHTEEKSGWEITGEREIQATNTEKTKIPTMEAEQVMRPIFDVGAHPFSYDIMADLYAAPFQFKQLNIDKYCGFSDPTTHIQMFNYQTSLLQVSDQMKCRLFPTTLKQHSITWFFSLPVKSIEKFNDIATQFLHNYTLSRSFTNAKPHQFLRNILQKENESLEAYLCRFQHDAMNANINVSTVWELLVQEGLSDIFGTPTKDLADFWQRAKLYDGGEGIGLVRPS